MSITVTRPELLEGGSDELFRQMIHDSLGFSARLQEIRNRLAAVIGLSGPAYSILISINHLSGEGGVGITRVGEHLHLSGAFVTLEVAKLVKSGLVSKVQNPEDGRRVILRVTDKAQRLLDTLSATQRPVNDTIFESLDAGTFRTFADVMSSLVTGTEGALALLRFREEQEAVASKRSGGA